MTPTFRKQSWKSSRISIKKSYNNNGKPWKSSRISRVKPHFFILHHFSSFFLIFSFFVSSVFCFFPLFFSFSNFSTCQILMFFHFFLFFFLFSVVQTDAKTRKNRREVVIVKMMIFFGEKKIFLGLGGQVIWKSPFEGDAAFIFFFFIFHFCFSCKKVSLLASSRTLGKWSGMCVAHFAWRSYKTT